MYDGIAAAQGALQEIARVRVTLARQKGAAAADSLDRELAARAAAAARASLHGLLTRWRALNRRVVALAGEG